MVREQIVWFYSPWNVWGFSCGWMAAISASLTLIVCDQLFVGRFGAGILPS